MQRSAKTYVETGFPLDARLIILHPNFESQHLLIPKIAERSGGLLSMTVQAPNTGLEAFWQSFAALFADTGRADLPRLASNSTPAKAATAALNVLKPLGPLSILIDSFDLALDQSVAAWLARLAAGLAEGSRVIIGTRRLPIALLTEALSDEVLAPHVAIFPLDDDRMLLNYLAITTDLTMLEVYAHGTGHALVNGRLIDRWDGVLPRNLFFYLVDRGMVTRDEIFQTFWPDLSVKEATNVFHVTKRKISELLGFDLTTYWSGFYRISPNIDLHYDVVQFGEFMQNTTIAEGDEAVALLEKAIHLYRGPFLSSLDAAWITARRDDLRSTYVEALSTLGKICEGRGDGRRAVSLYQRAMVVQPHREDLARAIMSIHQADGDLERALDVFAQLTEALKRNYNVAPDKKTAELAEQSRRQLKTKR